MKNTLKKLMALALGIVLVMSLCSVSFAAIKNATDEAFAAIGIVDGNDANSTSIVNSPDGSGDKVVLFSGKNTRPNVEPKADWVEGVTYTVSFKYWMAKEHTGGSFQFYYGKGTAVSGKTASTSFSVDNSHIGDGQWHTKSVKFTYKVPTSNTANTKVFLTFFTSDVYKIYMKDFVVKAESFANINGNFDILKNDDGTVKNVGSSFTYGSSGLINKSTVGDDGNIIFAPSANGNCTTLTDTYRGYVQFLKVRNVTTKDNGKITLTPGNTYTVIVKYKGVALNSNGYGGFGVGYQVNDGTFTPYTGTGSSPVQMVDSVVYTALNEEYNTFITTIKYDKTANADLVIAIPYTGQKIAIESTKVVRVTTDATLISAVTYNDNGLYGAEAGFVGDAITVEGNNGYMGEECKGWSSNTALTDTVTTIPAEDTTLYAKYNTIVISHFNFTNAMRAGYDNYDNITAKFVTASHIQFNTTTVGFMIPAYDYIGDNDSDKGHYDWYSFTKGQEYIVAVEGTNLKLGSKDNEFVVTAATAAGSGGKRSTSNQGYLGRYDAGTNKATFTCKFADGYNNAIIRGTSENATTTADIQKIIITKVSADEPFAKLTAVSKRDASEKLTAGVRFKSRVAGNIIKDADEAGFVVVPTAVLGEKTVADYVADGGIVTKCVNYNKESGAHVIYDGYVADKSGVFGAYYDYQIVLTGLTSLSNEALDLRGVEFTIAFYTTDNNGTVYHDTYTTSYNAIAGIK